MKLHTLGLQLTKGRALDGTKSIITSMWGNSESLCEDTVKNRKAAIKELRRAITLLTRHGSKS